MSGMRMTVQQWLNWTMNTQLGRPFFPQGDIVIGANQDADSRHEGRYLEVTTLNQKLVTKKNRKARRLQEQHPEVHVKVLYQRDYLHLLVKYGLDGPSLAKRARALLTRKNDATLDFDLVEVMEQSRDNPVFYVQYCHARCRSILRHAAVEMPAISLDPVVLAGSDLNRLTDSGELDLIKRLAEWPRLLESAAEAHEPHRVAFYLYDLAAAFHGQWNKGKDHAELRFLLPDDPGLTAARLARRESTT